MGKPFEKELNRIEETVSYTLSCDIALLQQTIAKSLSRPLYVIGSGGSLSACFFAEQLHQTIGSFAKAVTPLETFYQKNTFDSNAMFISASGRNKDILFAYDQCIQKEPESIINLCTSAKSPLASKSANNSIAKTFEFPLPSGKDGFLASNSLVAFYILLARGYGVILNKLHLIKPAAKWINTIPALLSNVEIKCATAHVLYGGWSKSVAVDLESKFTEAGLCSSLLADYRNFGHGRHNWFDKKKNSIIIALITPEEKQLAEKTLACLPKSIPVIRINSEQIGPASAIDLLIKSFFLVNEIGKLQGIDPGRPGVPAYGSKLYHLSYSSLMKKPMVSKNETHLFIQRKIKPVAIENLSPTELKSWENKLGAYTKRINQTHFGSIILDYDRTLCSDENRLTGPTLQMKNELIKVLKAGFLLGIVSGRGQSIRRDLQKCIPKAYWKNVMVGYYNGAEIGFLSNDSLPRKSEAIDPAFREIQDLISQAAVDEHIEVTARSLQLTIESKNNDVWATVKPILYQKAMLVRNRSFLILESSRSIDIIKRPEVSKLNMIDAIKKELEIRKLPENCLCIGDKGRWPGNDFELLNTDYSLSVNEVSLDPTSCWNIAPLSIRNTDACLVYLKSIKLYKHYFKMTT